MSQYSRIKLFMHHAGDLKVLIQNAGGLWEVTTTSGRKLGAFGRYDAAANCAHRHLNPVKARRWYRTLGTPAAGGYAAVPGERVRVTGFEQINGERWCRVRLEDGGRVMMHPYGLVDEEAPR